MKRIILAVCIILAAASSLANAIELEEPVRLKADGEFIDTAKQTGHAGPVVMDFDKDGKTDLLAGSFSGNIQIFRNIGSNQEPLYEDKGFLEAGGERVKFHNW